MSLYLKQKKKGLQKGDPKRTKCPILLKRRSENKHAHKEIVELKGPKMIKRDVNES